MNLKIDNDNKEQIFSEFNRVAKILLNETIIKTPCESYLIREIEFYYFSKNHLDYYCHKNERQLSNSRLYFHRFKNFDTYKRLKQKGIDITIGNNSNHFGGILLRTLQNFKTKEIISGIGNITNKIIDEIGGAKVISTIYEKDYDIFHENSILKFIKTKNNKLKIYKRQRIGLNFKKEDSDKFFLMAKYNFFTYPEIEELI